MAEKNKITAEFAPRCRKTGKSEKSRILDEYLALKDAILLIEQKERMDQAVDRLLNSAHAAPVISRRGTKCHGYRF